ncbi:MAG: chorismate mutase [Gemmatimonadota bacterium]
MTGDRDVDAIRARIEAVDRAILDRVAERLELARRIGGLKRESTAATLDTHREAAVIRRAVEQGRQRGLPDEAVRDLFWTLVGLCRDAQLDER